MSELKQGYHIRRNNQDIGLNPNDVPSKSFPRGTIPFFFNIIVFLLIMVLGILYGNKQLHWSDIWVISSVWSVCFNGMWYLGRKNFLSNLRYQMHLIARTIRLTSFIDKIDEKRNVSSKSFDNIKEFNIYTNQRSTHTKMFFIFSWLFSLINLISSLITMFIMRY